MRTIPRWSASGAAPTCCRRLTDPSGGLAATDPVRGQIDLTREDTEPIRPDLLALFEKEELVKYLAEEELYE